MVAWKLCPTLIRPPARSLTTTNGGECAALAALARVSKMGVGTIGHRDAAHFPTNVTRDRAGRARDSAGQRNFPAFAISHNRFSAASIASPSPLATSSNTAMTSATSLPALCATN